MRKFRWFELVLVAISSVVLFLSYPPQTVSGRYAIETARYTYTDDKRTDPLFSTGESRHINVDW